MTRLRRTFVFFSLPDSAINHSINQYEIGPFLTASQAPNGLLTDVGMVRKGFGDEPFKDVTMERVRVEEFEESLCEDCGWVNLVFLWGFSLNILSGSFLHFVGMRGICTYVCLEWEESVFQNRTGWRLGLATWLSCKFKPRTNRMASLDILSFSSPHAWHMCNF